MQRKYKLRHDKFRINLYGVILCTGLITTVEGKTKGNEIQDATSLIAEFIQNYMKPYIEGHSGIEESLYAKEKAEAGSSYQKEPLKRSPHRQSTFESDIAYPRVKFSSKMKSAIKEVVNELKPFLQDDEHDYDKYLENDETTIVEILPKTEILRKPSFSEANVPNIYKYEEMKSDIKQALEKENVSGKTRRLVTKTLDELIAQVLSNKCNWKSVNASVFRSGKPSMTSKEWDDLKIQYLEFLDKKQQNFSGALQVFNDFHDFFSKVINESQSKSGRLRFKCRVIDEDRKVVARSAAACVDFKVCSTELKDFLQNIYDSLNETVVGVFTNYAAMYVRDVSDGDDENSLSIPSVLERAAKIVEQRVAKVYIQELPAFQLDDNRTEAVNIKNLRNHVKSTMKRVLKHINKHLNTDLASIKPNVLDTIKKDIDINLNVELRNQETELKHRVCTVFMKCNGRLSETRRSFTGKRVMTPNNPSSIYVKLHISVDEKSNDDVSQPKRRMIITTKSHRKHTYRVTRTTVYANNSSPIIHTTDAGNN